MSMFEAERASALKHLQDLRNGRAVPTHQTTDPEVKKMLQRIVEACRPNREEEAQRYRAMRTVLRILAKYNLPFHYGAPPWPPEEWPWE